MFLFSIAYCLTQSFCLENELELFKYPTIHAIAKVHTTNTETTDSWNESHWSPHSSAILCWETLDPGIYMDANWKQTICPNTFSRPSTSPHGTGTPWWHCSVCRTMHPATPQTLPKTGLRNVTKSLRGPTGLKTPQIQIWFSYMGRACKIGSAAVMRGLALYDTMFGQVFMGKEHPNKHRDLDCSRFFCNHDQCLTLSVSFFIIVADWCIV